MELAVELTGVSRMYALPATTLAALDDVSVGIGRGTFVAVMGATGSGKSTLLRCAAGLERPTAGSVRLAGRDRRVAGGGTALDPEVVRQLLASPTVDEGLARLTVRERDILSRLAEGRSNRAIADGLHLSLRSVEKHVTAIFTKLDLPPAATDHRRVLAVLRFLNGTRSP